jgi:hypothetical protein
MEQRHSLPLQYGAQIQVRKLKLEMLRCDGILEQNLGLRLKHIGKDQVEVSWFLQNTGGATIKSPRNQSRMLGQHSAMFPLSRISSAISSVGQYAPSARAESVRSVSRDLLGSRDASPHPDLFDMPVHRSGHAERAQHESRSDRFEPYGRPDVSEGRQRRDGRYARR